MALFGKSKKYERFEDVHNDNLFTDDDDFAIKPARNRPAAPHALTPDEVLAGDTPETISMEHSRDGGSVYDRLKEQERRRAESAMDDDYVPSWAIKPEPVQNDVRSEAKREVSAVNSEAPPAKSQPAAQQTVPVHTEPTSMPAEPTTPVRTEPAAASDADDFLERCRQALQRAAGETAQDAAPEKPVRSPEDIIRDLKAVHPNPEMPKTPVFHLDLFDKTPDESPVFAPRTPAPEQIPETEASTPEEPQPSVSEEPAQDEPAQDEPADGDANEKKLEVEVIPTDAPDHIMNTTGGDMRIYGKVVNGSVFQHTPDGDIDISEMLKTSREAAAEEEKTILFGNISNVISKKADDFADDLDFDEDEEDYDDDKPYYETNIDFDDADEYKNLNDAARLRTKLMSERTNQTIITAFTAAATVLMVAASLAAGRLFSEKIGAIVSFILLAATVIFNYGIFKDFKNLFHGRPGFDSCAAVASLLMLVQSAVCTFVYNGEYADISAAAAFLLTVNGFANKLKISRILTGLEKIATSEKKRAVTAAEGKAASIMASGAVDGEVYALSGKEATNIRGYMKNSSYASPLQLKMIALFLVSLLVALAAGAVGGVLGGAKLGLTAAALSMCCLFPACAALTCELPMYFLSKKLARHGAAIAGYKGAYYLNLANVAAVNTSDLFPEGSVKLYNMKTLSENEIGHSITEAAAVAIAAGSPLSGIFREIIGTVSENSLPKVNGVRYEDKMGISGWIGERTILIGNRNLMQGHNIAVPPVSVDHKILRAGYFPVYIACDGVPCLLFIVKYEADPEIASELRALCATGMTVVVNPNDPNATETMLCDYFDLPNDALRVMNHNGRTVYEEETGPVESVEAPAAFRSVCGFFSAVSSSIRLGGVFAALTALFVIAAIVGAAALLYLGVTSRLGIIHSAVFVAYQLLFVIISAVLAKVKESS